MDTNIKRRFKPRARMTRVYGLRKDLDFWVVWCDSYEGCGASLEQAYRDWQVQSRFRMFA